MIPARLVSVLVICLFLQTLIPMNVSSAEPAWWNDTWSFRQELPLPIDTSYDQAKHQPIDISLSFSEPCWARNEQDYSLRIISQDGDLCYELESQIYDLNFSDATHLSTCNVVFLIPEQATGNEHYYVYYNEKETPSAQYPDHLQIEEAHYYFAPIPGYPFQSDYYKITEDGYIVYGVAYEGQFLGVSTAQQVTLFKDQTGTVTTPKDGLAFASFDYFYYAGASIEQFQSTIQRLISKQILIDGNLMVSCTIVSETEQQDFKTTVTYTYYYNPDHENRRINVHVKHEALKPSQVVDEPGYSESSGNIASFQVGEFKSPSIQELNFGQMFPYLNLVTQDNRTVSYPLDMNPDYTPEGITIINTKDDIDLGKKGWISFDEGTTGIAHSLIFGSTQILQSGTDERDGIQIKAVEAAGPGLLGLHTTAQTFYCSRNSYNTGTDNDLSIPDDFVVEYDAEFYSSMKGGYPAVDNESKVYQQLVQIRPSHQEDSTEKEEEADTYTLTTFVHLAPSAPMGTALSLLTGRNFSYISAELYQAKVLMSSDIAGRIRITSFPSFSDARFLKKIATVFSIFDLKNFTFFKKIRFEKLEPGTYLVKIFKEHPKLGKERKYIGYRIIEVQQDTSTHIVCRPEAHLQVDVQDQQGKQISEYETRLLSDDIIIAQEIHNQETTTSLSAPCLMRGTYQVQILYNGFLIYDSPVPLRLINRFIPRKISVDTSLYDLTITLQDRWGIPPSEPLHPTLTSTDMKEPQQINAEDLGNGQYRFHDLYPATYTLQVSSQSSLLEETITMTDSQDKTLTLVIPTDYNITLRTYDARGILLSRAAITLEREGKTITLDGQNGLYTTQLPPGRYQVTVRQSDTTIGKRTLTVISERSFDLLTNEEPLFPLIVIIVVILCCILGAILLLRKKEAYTLVKFLAIALMMTSLVVPWWTLQGSSIEQDLETSTNLYLLPANLITVTITPTVIAGERASASIATLFTLFINALIGAIVLSSIFIIAHLLARQSQRKKLSKVFLVLGFLFLIFCIGGFYGVMAVITKVGVGGVFGNGPLTTTIPGETPQVLISSTWGPSSGFYLCMIALILLVIAVVLERKQHSSTMNL